MMTVLAESGWLPDGLLRFAMRRLLSQRLRNERARQPTPESYKHELMLVLQQGPMAIAQDDANAQHYEVPSAFYQIALGPRLKYSSCYWPQGVTELAAAEEAMLTLTCQRAQLENGQHILELGCGWGSLSLWMAEKYPQSRITAISNSASQKTFIDEQAGNRGLSNLTVITTDVSQFDTEQRFDRVVSVEMFEHLRNHRLLMQRIYDWLTPGGKLFVHLFCHRELFYLFETDGDNDWMARHFFTGGVMPSFDLLERSGTSLQSEEAWSLNGNHYALTLEAWLVNADREKEKLMPVLVSTYGEDEAARWLQRWRMFFMACAELFSYGQGDEWVVGHFLFSKQVA